MSIDSAQSQHSHIAVTAQSTLKRCRSKWPHLVDRTVLLLADLLHHLGTEWWVSATDVGRAGE